MDLFNLFNAREVGPDHGVPTEAGRCAKLRRQQRAAPELRNALCARRAVSLGCLAGVSHPRWRGSGKGFKGVEAFVGMQEIQYV